MDKNEKNKVTLTSYDPVEEPEDVIHADKDEERKEEFRKANIRIAKIIPEYFLSQRKKRKNSSLDEDTIFSQELKVTRDNATIAVHATTKQKPEGGAKKKEEVKTKEREE